MEKMISAGTKKSRKMLALTPSLGMISPSSLESIGCAPSLTTLPSSRALFSALQKNSHPVVRMAA